MLWLADRAWCEAMFTFHSHSRSLIFDVNEVRIWTLVTSCAIEVHFKGSSPILWAHSDPNLIQTRMWADAQRDGRPSNIGGANEERMFRNSLPCRMPQSLTDTHCSSAVQHVANIGERKTWTQSEFCTWQNSVSGQEPPKVYT